jgi:DNA-binding XRE family transcriptional regulator
VASRAADLFERSKTDQKRELIVFAFSNMRLRGKKLAFSLRSQCRAARALLHWGQEDLEKAASVAKKTIADFEREARTPYPRTLTDIRAALERAGVEFIDENGRGPGVRLVAKPKRKKSR